jgi:Asp-tRNA(Asn)/Glu-tRNA(Gln) amidotransferase A subunit family amidase
VIDTAAALAESIRPRRCRAPASAARPVARRGLRGRRHAGRGEVLPGGGAARALRELAARADDWFERHPIALCPTVPVTAPLASEGIASIDGEAPRPGRKLTLCTYANALGLPAATVPAGRYADGLPLAVQVFAARGRDLDVIAVAAELKRALGGALDPAESPRSALSPSR